MANWQHYDLAALAHLDVTDPTAQTVQWQGRASLRMEGGFGLLPDVEVADALVEVDLGVDTGAAYPGLAFRGARPDDIELLYCQPHTSGQWDALQYDPVFHGSNTWQIFHGPGCQATAAVPSGTWLTLQVELRGLTATARVLGCDTPPLVVPRLAHGNASGRLGVWTFRPAYFAELRLRALESAAGSDPPPVPPPPADLVSEWHLEGYGAVRVEPNGTLNLNRYLPMSAGPAILRREFTAGPQGRVDLRFGFSDELCLGVDGADVFSGAHRFTGFSGRENRGYVEPDTHRLSLQLAPGRHELTAEVAAREPFGWGIALGCMP